MIPSSRTNARGAAEATLHSVRNLCGSHRFFSARDDAFRDGKNGSKIIAWMCRLFRKVSVVVIEIANAAAVRESAPIRRRFVRRADDCRSFRRRKIRSYLARDHARFL